MKLIKLMILLKAVTMICIGQTIPIYTWKGKDVSYKTYRDSLRSNYLRFCDSLQKHDTIKLKSK
jgi:hypothetical protein